METIQLEVEVNIASLEKALAAFDFIQQKFSLLQQSLQNTQTLFISAFSAIQGQLANFDAAIGQSSQANDSFLETFVSATLNATGFAASLVELSGTQTLLGETLRKGNSIYLDFEETIVSVKDKALELGGSFANLAKTTTEKAITSIQSFGSNMVAFAKTAVTQAISGTKSLVQNIAILATTAATQAVVGIKALGSGLLAFGKSAAVIGKSLLTNPIFLIGSVLAGAAALVIANWDSIVGLFQSLKKKLQPLFDTIGNAVSAVVDKVVGFIQSFVNANKEIFEAVSNIASSIYNKNTLCAS